MEEDGRRALVDDVASWSDSLLLCLSAWAEENVLERCLREKNSRVGGKSLMCASVYLALCFGRTVTQLQTSRPGLLGLELSAGSPVGLQMSIDCVIRSNPSIMRCHAYYCTRMSMADPT